MTKVMEKQEEITKVLAGKSIYRDGSLSFSCPKVELYFPIGECGEGSFVVTGREGIPLVGTIVTSDIHVECLTPVFTASPAEISFRFHTVGLDEGDCVRGEFKVISNQGEYSLSYMIHVIPKIFETSLGQMKNLFHFTNLAKINWEEAVRLFYQPDFEKILTGNDRQYRNIYRALKNPPVNEQKVEEFLLQIRKKQRVEYIADKEKLSLPYSEGLIREVLTLTRNGWGYTRLTVETEGRFLRSEKETLSDNDFLGNHCQLGILIDSAKMHAGTNLGKIHFFNEYVSLEIPVKVSYNETMFGRFKASGKSKVFEFFQLYIQYSMGRLAKREWLSRIGVIVDNMNAQGRVNPIQELFQAHIFITKERYNEARWQLERAKELIVRDVTLPEVWCYYLYLTTLVGGDEEYIKNVTEEIRHIYRNHPTEWEIAWLLLNLDEECSNSLSRRWVFLEQQFEKGCHSPVWYMEAAVLARKNPAFLMKNTPFVIQTLNFMAKYDYLTDECISQVHYLAGRLKAYSERMYDVLQACYAKKNDLESLRAICSLLIKGGKIGTEYASWYREGIKRELWLTRLYEYYMLSIDLERQEEIPAAAIRYFSYRSELPYERTAYLYAYVLKKSADYPDLYRTYLPEMESFLRKQMEQGHINRAIGYIFKRLIREEIVNGEFIERFAASLFVQEIKILTKDIRRVIVVHGRLRDEIVCPVVGTLAYIPVYDEDYSIVFERKTGHRMIGEVEYEQRVITFSPEMLLEILPQEAGILTGETGVLLYQCEHGRAYTIINHENVRYARLLWANEKIQQNYRNELGMKLLQYYMEQDMTEELDAFLNQLNPRTMSGKERTEALRCLIIRGMYETAYEWIARYGADRLIPKQIVRLCSRLLQNGYKEEAACMTALAYQAFRMGKYDDNVLQYLCKNYRGMLKELREIWIACENFEVDSYELSERLLMQMLFAGEYVPEETEIFIRYLGGSADEGLKNGYLEHFAYRYFVGGQQLDAPVWKELLRKARNREEQDVMSKLAILEHLSEQKLHDEEESAMIKRFLVELMLEKGLMFSFFRKFEKIVPQLIYYEDKTFLEYRTESDYPMMLHYMVTSDGKGGEYRTEELKSCYPGIYTKCFPIFMGETMEYYISEKREGKERLVQNGTLVRKDSGKESAARRFRMVNDVIVAASLQETEKAERELEKYYKMEFFAEELFSLL